jgi:putative PIG3 family NAD(P)H quinone oxidoreductase
MQALTARPESINPLLPYTLVPTVIPDPPHPDPLPPTHVAIEVVCAGVNRADILQARGLYPPPLGESEILGLEVSGIVRAMGAGVAHLGVGQRVAALLAGGGYAEMVHVPACQVIPLPPSWSFSLGAAFPEAYTTAYMALGVEGGLHAGDMVLVTGGGSGVGCAAIQLAKLAGARVIATAGTAEKGEVCRGLGADFSLNYRDENVVERVAEITKGRGVDLLLDVVGGERFAEHLSLLTKGGRLVSIGFLGGRKGEVDLSRLIRERLRIVGTNLRSRSSEEKGALVRGVWTMIEEKVQEGTLVPRVDSVFPMERAHEAHERMIENKNLGKLIIQIRPELGEGDYGC